MDIKKFYDCNVKLYTNDGRYFIGLVTEYYYADENENGMQSVVLDCPVFDEPVEIYEDNIADIEIYEGV